MNGIAAAVVTGCLLLSLAGCATRAFVAPASDRYGFVERALTQSRHAVEVVAAVPSPEEVVALFGADLYSEGIQPVWLRVDNARDSHVRVTPYSIDQEYFSPLEVAWLLRKRFRSDSRDALDRWFVDSALERYVPAGGSRSGFVFTHASEGTKGFNVDVHADSNPINFTFFVPLPGFTPDYMRVDFRELYEGEEVVRGDRNMLRRLLRDMPCCTSGESSEASGDPLNVAIVGTGEALRRSLLRGDWRETEEGNRATRLARTHHYRGRPPDGIFLKARPDGSERKELRLWLAPVLIDGEPLWIGHTSYDMGGTLFSRDRADPRIDPDVDDARMFLLQNLWYHQSLRAFGMAGGIPEATIDAPRANFHGSQYFTDGLRAVLFVSEDPVALDETEILLWEAYEPPT